MGNDASKAVKAAEAKAQFDTTIKKINQSLNGTAKHETDGLAGCKDRREIKKRSKERKIEYKTKQKERTERKSLVSQQWTEHRTQNAERPKKSWLGNKKKVEPKHWNDY